MLLIQLVNKLLCVIILYDYEVREMRVSLALRCCTRFPRKLCHNVIFSRRSSEKRLYFYDTVCEENSVPK